MLIFLIILHAGLFGLMYLIFGVLIIISIASLDFSEELFNFLFIYSLMLIDIIYVVFAFVGCY